MIYIRALDVPHDHLIAFNGTTYRGTLSPELPLYPAQHPRLGTRLEPTPGPFPPPREPYLPGTRKQEADWDICGGRVFLVAARGDYELLGKAPLFADWHSGLIMLTAIPMAVIDGSAEVITLVARNGVVLSQRTSRKHVLQGSIDR